MRKRILVSLALWLFCLPALALSVSTALGGGLEASDTGGWAAAPLVVAALALPYAWVALLAMTIMWILHRKLHRWWPISGTAAAVLGLLAFSVSLGPAAILMGVVYASPGMAFAAYLCRYHLAPAFPA